MERISNKFKKHENAIIGLLEDYKSERIDIEMVIDKKNRHYQLLRTISDEKKRYFSSILMHFSLREDATICLFENSTEIEVADVLIEKGVRKSDILVGFLPQSARAYAGYAVA